MKLSLEFAFDKPGLVATELARLFLDLQRVTLSLSRIQHAKDWSEKELVDSSYLTDYGSLIKFFDGIEEESLCIVGRVSKSSPGLIEIFIKEAIAAREGLRKAFRKIFDALINDEYVISSRAADVAMKWEDVRAKKIENLGNALDVVNKIPDPIIRQGCLETLLTNLESLQSNPGKIKRVEITDEDPPEHKHH